MNQIKAFVEKVEDLVLKAGLDVSNYEMDHICYRVETTQEYDEWKQKLTALGKLLVEDEINGRLICTFELLSPVIVGNRSIRLIELPMPKSGSTYPSGWEHAEFVLGEGADLEQFAKSYPNLVWCYSGMKKKLNSDIRLQLSNDPPISIKFHQIPSTSARHCD